MLSKNFTTWSLVIMGVNGCTTFGRFVSRAHALRFSRTFEHRKGHVAVKIGGAS